MPVVPISDGQGGVLWYAPAMVASYMLFPTEDASSAKQRRAYMAIHVAEVLLGKAKTPGSLVTINRQFFADLLDSPSKEEVEQLAKRHSRAGMVAGFLLSLIASLYPVRPSDASVLKAVEIANHLLEGHDLPSSPAYLLRQWSLFRPVAHLWAAFLFMRQTFPGFDPEEAPFPLFIEFLSLGEDLRKQGEGIVARGQAQKHGPVLDPLRTFKLPADFIPTDSWTFVPKDPSEAVSEILKNYRAPKKL